MYKEPRQVGIKTIIDLLKQNHVYLLLGLLFTFLPILIGGIFFVILSTIDSDSPKVDYALVDTKGSMTQAVLRDIEVLHNITINNEHPRLIRYSYKSGAQIVDDSFRVLDSAKASHLVIGDSVQVKHYNGQSIILGLKPYSFPIEILYMVLIPLFCIGILVTGLLYWRMRGKIHLIKYGNVREAEVISMTLTTSRAGSGQKVTVHYRYATKNGQKILGQSTTTDYSMLTSNKQGDFIKIFVSEENETKSHMISRLDAIRNNWGE